MCFDISEKYPNALVAKRDITCYKIVFDKGEWYTHHGYEAACQRYAYYPGKTTKRVDIESTRFHATIDEGYHSYRSLKVLKEEQERWDDSLIGIKMIIPKGTLYYKNDREYVSERLKCVEPLK